MKMYSSFPCLYAAEYTQPVIRCANASSDLTPSPHCRRGTVTAHWHASADALLSARYGVVRSVSVGVLPRLTSPPPVLI